MTPHFEGGIFSESAMPMNVDVQVNAKTSSVVVFAADSSFIFHLDPCFVDLGLDPPCHLLEPSNLPWYFQIYHSSHRACMISCFSYVPYSSWLEPVSLTLSVQLSYPLWHDVQLLQ